MSEASADTPSTYQEGAAAYQSALEWYRSLYEGIPSPYLTLDFQGTVLAANAASLERLRYDLEELTGRSILDLFVLEERAEFERVFRAAQGTDGPAHSGPFHLRCKDGNPLTVKVTTHARSKRLEKLAILNCEPFEVSSQEEVDSWRAQEWERFFSLSVDLLSITGFDGYFHRLNPAWQEVLGYSLEELMEEPFIVFVHPDDRKAALGEARRLLQGADSIGFVNRYRCRDGSYKWLWWRSKTSLPEQLIYGVARDITEQKAVEQALRRSEQLAHAQSQELAVLNRLKDDFLSTVSHELRTPLTNIKLAAKLLAISNDAKTRRHYVQILESECNRELELVNDLLDLQQVEAGARSLHIESIELSEWLPRLLVPFDARTRQQSLSLSVALDPALTALDTDPTALGRILGELVNNACKYTPAGHRLAVEVRPVVVEDRELIEFAVSNWGVEIPPQAQERIFEKFYRLSANITTQQPGTGLGLALVRKLVQALGGTIRVESIAGKTAFFVTLPRKTRQAPVTVLTDPLSS